MDEFKLFWLMVVISWSLFNEHVFAGSSQSGSLCANTPRKVTVFEGLTAGTVLFMFKQDQNKMYTFHEDSGPALNIFEITPAGIVTNIVTLDHEDERGNEFTLTVLVNNKNNVGNSLEEWVNACSLTITILDLNDNSPQFKKDLYVGFIQENLPEGTVVQGLHGIYATDLDVGANSTNSYKILPGNGHTDKFEAVTEKLGGIKFLSIRTKAKLDREESSFYVLTVVAYDGGKPARTASTQIRINIEDVNDCFPQFTLSEYSVSVLSTTPISTQILKVHAQDQDSEQNSKIYYFFKRFRTRIQNDNFFTLDPYTGVMRVARKLDLTAGNLIQITIVAQDRGNPPKRTETVVKIELYEGRSQPIHVSTQGQERFPKRSFLIRICEDLPINAHILHLKPKFTILSSQQNQEIPFEVDANSNFLYLKKSLDFESRQRYEFSLLLTSFDRSEANVTVLIDDADENFNAPVFKKANIAAIFQRNWKSQHFVTKVKASDPDKGLNGQVNYRVVDGDGVGRFYFDGSSIFSEAGLNWEGVEQLSLVIEARDNATRWKSAKQFVLISVEGVEDCNPMFERVVYQGHVPESKPGQRYKSMFVAVMKAQLCQQRRVEYLITNGNSRKDFKIDKYSGIVSTRKLLDRERQAEYTLEITARNGSSSSKALLLIKVEDINDNDPLFLRENYQVEITENRGKIENLLCLVATDKDSGQNAEVNYIIDLGNKTLFHIDSTSGILSSESLNFEVTRKHVLRINATDHGDPPRSSFTTVEVVVKNVNDPPKFESKEIAVSVDEEKPADTTVISLPVRDEDVGKNGEFDCTYENIDPQEFGKFQVVTTRSGCEVRNKVLLKWFEGRSYSLRVKVTDRAPLLFRKSDVTTVRVKIRDLNNHDPVFLQDAYYSSVPPGTIYILTVSATDEDNGRNARIRYSLAIQSKIFKIHARIGKLTAVKGKLNVGKHRVEVVAEDQGNPKRRTKVTCFIIVANEVSRSSPKISLSPPNPKLYENVGLNTLVTTARLKKPGVHYRIVGGNIGHAFNISQRGEISVANMLDYETVKEYRLVIRAMYTLGKKLELAIEKVFKIPILDINDNDPIFTILKNPLNLNINTRVFRGTIITKTLAYDADSANTLTYTIKPSSVPFQINSISGEITARNSLPSRSRPWSFTVVVEDGGTERKRSELKIRIRILTGHSSLKISEHQLVANVDEGPLGVNRDIVSFSVKSATEHALTYSIIRGNYGNAFCADVTGSLYAVRELDRESRANYILSVSVNDGESSENSDVHVTVNDINDHRPQFPNNVISIFTDENTGNQKIWTLNAEDKDLENITYGVVGTLRQSYSNAFIMDHGIVMLTQTLDREEEMKHVLTIVAEDQAKHKTYTRAVVLVRDKNDNSPRFLSRDYAQSILLNAPRGYVILRTLATDIDFGLNGQISYTIDPSSKMFAIDESTGWISVASELTHGSFIFNVTAEDHGTPRRSDTVSVKIVIEVSAGPPRFLYTGFPRGFNASVLENQDSGIKVLKLTAVSEDTVSYALYQTNVTDFTIDPISGEITTTKSLDYENIKYYEFTVSATDHSERISVAHVRVHVVNINDNKPQILNANRNNEISCRIRQDTRIGSILIKIQAQDLDNDSLRFHLIENTKPGLFRIDAAGNINTTGSLQGIKDERYLTVTVRDNGSPVLEVTATVIVVIVNYEGSLISMAEVSEDERVGKTIPVSPKITPRYKSTQYSLIYPLQSPFTIHSTLGNLSLKTGLDYEEQQNYFLTVRLQETGNKNDYFDVDIRIAVKDENDNKPEFVFPGNFTSCTNPRKIHENAQRGSLVYQFKARDKDSGLNGEIYYEMGECQDSQDCDDLFSLDSNTGELKTTGVSLTRPQYKVNISVYDRGVLKQSTQGCIMVKAGPWKPQFTKQEYHFEIDESAEIGQRVGVIEAEGFGVAVTYELRTSSMYFSVNPTTGELTLTSTLDYEKSSERQIELVIETKNEASSARVIIHVRDVNDCQPNFDQSTYTDYVPESAPVGSTVLKLHASDGDSGLNADIRYSLNSEQFIVDSYTGVVSTATLLDFETRLSYVITVTAHDRGNPSQVGTTQLVINIVNVNDNWPVFTSHEYSCLIWENAEPGRELTTVEATDADGDIISYDITGGNYASLFTIDSITGTLRLTKDTSLNLVGPYYILNITATDGVYWGHSVVKVNIRDINDHAPVFTKCSDYQPSIPENLPRGSTVLQVSASDEDLGTNGQVEYAIVHQSGTKFGIDRRSGRIETRTEFDREQDRVFSILVKATDGNSDMKLEERRDGSCSIEITITDVNDNYPVFERTSYTQNINENVKIGYRIIKVGATDVDEGLNAKISYSFKKFSSLFSIEPQTGVIKTRATLVNKKKQYILNVLATDHGDPPLSSEVDVVINVIETNDEPQFNQTFYEVTIPENFTKVKNVIVVTARSRNPELDVFYRIENGNTPETNSLGTFVIDPKGNVRLLDQLDREDIPTYTLTIRAETTSEQPLISFATLRVTLSDVNDCVPKFQQSTYKGNVSENLDPGAWVLKVNAVDRDLRSTIAYSFSIRESEYFTIHPETGVIRTKQIFDREKRNYYKFQVSATDKNNPSLTSYAEVHVKISDMNDMPPVFQSKNYSSSVEENEPIGTVIGTVIASDDDIGINAKITYSIKSGNVDSRFRIDPDNGQVMVNGIIDFEVQEEYVLVLEAWDGKYKDEARMVVTVNDVNDNSPKFEKNLYSAVIEENSPKDTLVTTLKAIDPDCLPIEYELSDLIENTFRIDSDTGDIVTNTVLDREDKDTYTFEAYARDCDQWTGTVKVTVNVIDQNDNAPVFLETSLKMSIFENDPAGSVVGKVEATDLDVSDNGRMSYGIAVDPARAFTIDRMTGVLKISRALDRENCSIFTLTVTATDHGTPSKSTHDDVIITVLDVNDNAPRFLQKVYEKTIAEDAKVGFSILQLTASDDDIGVNANLSFAILRQSYKEQFDFEQVDSRTGNIKLVAQLDYEKKTQYKFDVIVEDGGVPKFSDTATVIINVTDSNDCPPVFSQKYNFNLRERFYKNHTLPGRLLADDADGTKENAELRYSIPGDAGGKGFVVDPITGELSVVNAALDFERQKIHTFKVRATNIAPPYLYGESEVKIIVQDINDNPPELVKASRDQEILENSNMERHVTHIGRLRAFDRDKKPNGKPFRFGILSGNENNLFLLDSVTGWLSTVASFDREKKALYVLKVWVRDSGTPALTNNITVRVHVTDRNDNQHRAGYLELFVNIFDQRTISTRDPIGQVFVNDSDINDLRYYDVLAGDSNTFTINRLTGNIIMKKRPSAKQYKFRVRVSDRNSNFHPVECQIKINVKIIPSQALERSITLRFRGMTSAEFLTNIDIYRNEIAKGLKTIPQNVDIFSIQDGNGVVDVRLAAHGSPYYKPERIIWFLKKERMNLKYFKNVTVGYDACAEEPCKSGGCRSDVKLTGRVRTVDNGRGQAFGSFEFKVNVICESCKKMFSKKISCREKPCLNSGVCQDIPGGYLCSCPHQYQGPNCELTTRSFKPGEWVWLRAFNSCSISIISLEFSTLGENGLLLSAGSKSLGTEDTYDLLAIQLHNGRIRVELSLGDPEPNVFNIEKSKKLNDGEWHMVEIYRNATFIRVVLDECNSSIVTGHFEDRSNCEQTQTIRNSKFHSLDINTPVKLGGKFQSFYEGCIRNVKENGVIIDLKDISNSKGSQEGCPIIDKHCPSLSPCAGNASCVPSRKGFSCICPPGFGGSLCGSESVEQTFNESSFITYRPQKSFLKIYNPKFTEIQMMIRTRDDDGGPLLMIRDKQGHKRLVLRLTKENNKLSLKGMVILGRKGSVVKLTNTLLSDGQWHHVIISRNRNEVHLGIDLEPERAKVQGSVSFIQLQLTEESEIILGSAESADTFDGCIKDLRLNGEPFPHNDSNKVAMVTHYKNIKQGCYSGACNERQCPEKYFCYDKWRASKCLLRQCANGRCLNGGTCRDYGVNGVPMSKCVCREGFNGSRCQTGSYIIRLSADQEVINVKLVIGLSCFVLVLVLATLVIICYHRHQTNGKATFDKATTISKLNKTKNSPNKSLVVVEWREPKNEPNKTNNGIKNISPAKHSIRAHVHNPTRPTAVPVKSHPLEHKPLSQLPAWDIPPMIDIVLSPDSGSSTMAEDSIEDPDEMWQDAESRYVSQTCLDWRATTPEESPSETEPDDSKAPAVTWNDIVENGRKFYKLTRSLLAKNDGRPESSISTGSNSSSVVTVVENPLA